MTLTSRGEEEWRARRWWGGQRFSCMKRGSFWEAFAARCWRHLWKCGGWGEKWGVTSSVVRGENEAMHAAGAPFWPFHHWHTLLHPAFQRGMRREMMRHYVFLAKAVIGSERLWALLLCTSTYLFTGSHSSIYCICVCVCIYCTYTGLFKKNEAISLCNIFQGKAIENSSQVTSNLLTINFYLLSDKCSMWPRPPTSIQ